ncbi:DUF6809 family protein [Paenibacillus sp. FSL R7-0302]|uniref:DUF6809 family protein n=1 Tax=Paenibacillus sp. FSL R7-0302 TaxID=2921681 RepID=UPI0030FCF317
MIIIILEDLYYGSLRPNERMKPNDPESRRINQRIIDSLEMLRERLPEEDFDQIEKLLELHSESCSLHSALSFIQGYKIGALMMIEVFGEDKSSI